MSSGIEPERKERALIRKHALPGGRYWRVTFRLPAGVAAREAAVCGSFREWRPVPMVHRRDGSWSVTLTLPAGQSYAFRYLIDGERWVTDDAADGLTPNPYGEMDSLLTLEP